MGTKKKGSGKKGETDSTLKFKKYIYNLKSILNTGR